MVMIHQAWALTWEAVDTSTLMPKLPELTSSMFVPTWTPGEVIPKGAYDRDYSKTDSMLTDKERLGAEFWWFLVVGVPLISLLLISCCVSCCVMKCKSNRRKKKAAARESVVQPAQ